MPWVKSFPQVGRLGAYGGTPDQYGKNQPFLHTLIDSGGIVRQGGPAFSTNIFYWIGRGGSSLINQ
jgi:hypothetical protein